MFSDKINKIAKEITVNLNDKYIVAHFEELEEIENCMLPLILYPQYAILNEYQRAYSAAYYRNYFGDYEDPVTLNKIWLNFIEKYPEHQEIITIICKKTKKQINYFEL